MAAAWSRRKALAYRRRGLFLALVALLAWSVPARSDEPQPAEPNRELSADDYMRLANEQVLLEDFEAALPLAKRAVAMSEDNPREGWLRLLLGIHFSLEQYPEAAGVLERLVSLWPKKTYWMQISLVYATIGEGHKSLAALETAYREGFLTESRELVRLAQLYLQHEMPYKAAAVLEKGFEDELIEDTKRNWELLANSLIRAQELDRALVPLERAAELSEDGNLYMRIGQIHLEAGKRKKAAAAFSRAVEKGNLDRPDSANILLDVAGGRSGESELLRGDFWLPGEFERALGQPAKGLP